MKRKNKKWMSEYVGYLEKPDVLKHWVSNKMEHVYITMHEEDNKKYYYVDIHRKNPLSKIFKTKTAALKFAKSYMRKH